MIRVTGIMMARLASLACSNFPRDPGPGGLNYHDDRDDESDSVVVGTNLIVTKYLDLRPPRRPAAADPDLKFTS